VITDRPQRLEGFPYIGFQRYFVTTCTAYRQKVFHDATVARQAHDRFMELSERFHFRIVGYCFMPDHVHLVLIAASEQSDLPRFMKLAKQVTGYEYRRQHVETLWQPGYYDRILRDDEATLAVVRYTLENPVRAGLAKTLGEWPSAGSDVYTWRELLTAWEDQQT
jgi:putative transposase